MTKHFPLYIKDLDPASVNLRKTIFVGRPELLTHLFAKINKPIVYLDGHYPDAYPDLVKEAITRNEEVILTTQNMDCIEAFITVVGEGLMLIRPGVSILTTDREKKFTDRLVYYCIDHGYLKWSIAAGHDPR